MVLQVGSLLPISKKGQNGIFQSLGPAFGFCLVLVLFQKYTRKKTYPAKRTQTAGNASKAVFETHAISVFDTFRSPL